MSFARRSLLASLAFTALAALAALHFPAHAQAKKELVFGATAGPYSDQIKLGIKPILESKGYKVRVVEFNDYIQPNFALAQGDLDANAFQMNTVGQQSPGLWTHPDDQSHRYTDPDHWVELARLLERGRFDGVSLA